MRSSKPLVVFVLLFVLGLFTGCGGGGGGGGGGDSGSPSSTCSAPPAIALPNGSVITPVVGGNVLTLTVNGSTCSPATSANYANKPCVSVTICDASGANCQFINDILLDTGDYGFRIFQQALTPVLLAALTPVQVGSPVAPLYECVEYGDGSTVWGPVEMANVILGTAQTTQAIPVQVIGSVTSDIISGSNHACSNQLLSPTNAGYNGSLGLGPSVQDCGSLCVNSAAGIGFYFTCVGGACTPTKVPMTSQVQNPVANLSADYNNGVIVSLPSVPSTGAPSVTGSLILGIGTRANNIPSGVTAYGANLSNSFAYFTTTFNGSSFIGFLDTGSNGIFFTYPASTTVNGAFYAPSCALSLTATNMGASNAPNTSPASFQIENANSLFATGNRVFSNLGGPIPNSLFDWGLPFFLGRNVYIGINGRSSPGLATGPFWAY